VFKTVKVAESRGRRHCPYSRSANGARIWHERGMSATRHLIFTCIHAPASSRRSRSPAAPKKLSFLGRAVIAGFGQARHVEFDWIAALIAADGKETTNNAGQSQNETEHGLLPVGFCLPREKLPHQSSKPKQHQPRSQACDAPVRVATHGRAIRTQPLVAKKAADFGVGADEIAAP
jgi:hypothetical protein